jgi:hypothetical protein
MPDNEIVVELEKPEEPKTPVPNNNLVWVDPDEFNLLLDKAVDLIDNYGKHEGPCAPKDIDDPDSACVIHVDEMSRRHNALANAIKTFRPNYQKASPFGASSE